VEAMHEGYPDAKTKIVAEQSDKQMRSQERQSEMDREHQLLADERRSEQSSDLQDETFTQGLRTQQYEQAHDLKVEKMRAASQAKAAKAAAKNKPAAKPAAKKPAAKKK